MLYSSEESGEQTDHSDRDQKSEGNKNGFWQFSALKAV